MAPVQKQIVVVEYLTLLFAYDEISKQLAKFRFPIGAPGVGVVKDVGACMNQRPKLSK